MTKPRTPEAAMSEAMTLSQSEYWFPEDGETVRKALAVLSKTGWELRPVDGDVPPAGTRLVLVGEGMLEQFGAHTALGQRITAEWGEPDEHGWYEPRFTVSGDTEHDRMARLREAARFMLDLIDEVYGTDNEGMDLPEEAEYRRHRAVIEGAE